MSSYLLFVSVLRMSNDFILSTDKPVSHKRKSSSIDSSKKKKKTGRRQHTVKSTVTAADDATDRLQDSGHVGASRHM